MRMDYHLHSTHSGDGKSPMEDICRAAAERGLTHIALTDHHDIGHPLFEMKGIGTYVEEIDRCRALFPQLSIARGIELDYRTETWEEMRRVPARLGLDFALLSLHYIDGHDPYEQVYFENRSREQAYRLYLVRLAEMIAATEGSFVLGHVTYVAKFAPYADTALAYAQFPDELDEVLKSAVRKGYGLEVNTSGMKNGAGLLPGADVLVRFRELGGEIVTVGSDAHEKGFVGRWIGEAMEAVRRSGFRYVATYRGMQPQFVKID